jgi:hypothetical protein
MTYIYLYVGSTLYEEHVCAYASGQENEEHAIQTRYCQGKGTKSSSRRRRRLEERMVESSSSSAFWQFETTFSHSALLEASSDYERRTEAIFSSLKVFLRGLPKNIYDVAFFPLAIAASPSSLHFGRWRHSADSPEHRIQSSWVCFSTLDPKRFAWCSNFHDHTARDPKNLLGILPFGKCLN